jgi:subtilisin family serine protease
VPQEAIVITPTRFAAALLTATILTTAAPAAPLSDSLQKALDKAGGQGTVRIVVQMKDAERMLYGASMAAGDSAGRMARMKTMRGISSQSQKAFLDEFRTVGVMNAGASKKVRSYWLANAVALDADRETIEKIAARSDVQAVDLNDTLPAPKVSQSTLKVVPGDFTWGLARIHIPQVRALYHLTGAGVRVGHLDSGVTGNHPDLKGKILLFKDFSLKQAPEAYDDGGHGTHTAGTIVGGNASGKHIGVAPEAKIICGKIFGESGASREGIIAAMEWVIDPDGNPDTDDGAQIVSNSWGSDNPTNKTFWEPVKKWVDLGVFPSFACGNSGPNTVGTPAAFPHSFAIGSVDPGDGSSEFSSRGPVTWSGQQYIKPDVAAPGSSILSAWNTGNGYNAIQGTSMACPHVSGVVALMLQANPKLTVERIRQILESTADDRGEPGKDNLFGSGIVNPWKAIAQVVPSGELAGTLKTDGGQPVKGELTLPDVGLTVPTADDGTFSILVPAGTHKVVAHAFGMKDVPFTAKVVAGEATSDQLTLEKAAEGLVTGTVVNKDGKALKAIVTFPGTSLAAIDTAPDTGAFKATVPQGQYTMIVRSFGYEPKVFEGLAIAAQGDSLKVVLENLPAILVLDDDGHDHLQSYLTDSVKRAGHKFTVWSQADSGPAPADVLIQYPVVIWHTGFDYQTTFTAPEQAALKAYLASGGHLLLSSQLGAVNLRSSPLLAEVLHTKFVGVIKRAQTPVPPVMGVDGDPVSAGLKLAINDAGSQNNQEYPTIVLPADAKAVAFLNYEGEQRGAAGLRIEDGAAKVVYTCFGLEGVGDAAARDAFVKKALDYLMPRAEDALARVEAVDSMRASLLASRSPEAAAYFEYETYFVTKAAAALSQAENAEELLGKAVAAGNAADAIRAIRRAVRAR